MDRTTHTDTSASGLTRRGFLGVGLGAAAVTVAGCSGGKSASDTAGGGGTKSGKEFTGKYDGPPVTLAYWNGFTGGDGPFMKKLVAKFMQEHPTIKITQNTIQWADFYQKVPAAVQAGKGPDVGVMHQDQLATNAARKVILPLDDVAKQLNLSESDFPGDLWKAAVYKDQRYGIPLDVHSLAMYMNKNNATKAGLKGAPATKDEYMQALDTAKKTDPTPFWMPNRWPAHLMFYSLLWQNGGEPYDKEGNKATYDGDEGVAALSWMVDVVKKGYSPKNVAQDSQYVAFKNGKGVFTWDGIWQINDLKTAKVPFEIAQIPQIGQKKAVWANSHHFFMTKQTSNDDNKSQAAKVFIDWMSRQSAEWAGAGMIPIRKSVRDSGALDSTTQAPIAKMIDDMHFLPPVPGLGDLSATTIEQAVSDAVLLRKSPQDALKSAAEKATKGMEANKKKYGS